MPSIACILASMGVQYEPHGPISSQYLGLSLYFIAVLSVIIFTIRTLRRYRQPHRSFSPDLMLTFTPVFCATAYLALGSLRILEISSRVPVTEQLLKQRLSCDLRTLGMALAISSLMLLVIFLMRTFIKSAPHPTQVQGAGVS